MEVQSSRELVMSELSRIKHAMADGEHTDGDLQWCVERIEVLESNHEKAVTLVHDLGLSTGHADTSVELMEEVLAQYGEQQVRQCPDCGAVMGAFKGSEAP
jgi:hypothetical protein